MRLAAAYRCRRPPRRPRPPRRARRGLAALLSVTVVAGLLASAVIALQLAEAGERIRGHARHLAEAVAAEGYGLHHWLHAERTAGAVTAPAEGTARALTAAEDGRLAAHSATARWRRAIADATRPVLPRGWEIVHLVGTAGGLPDGILVLRPSDATVALPTWNATREALDVTLGTAEAGAAALATNALAGGTPADYDATRDRAVPASRYARLDTGAVLREDHAGHARVPMETGLRMGGNDIGDVAALEAETARIPEITGDCPDAAAGTLCAESLVLGAGLTTDDDATLTTAAAGDVTLAGDVSGITRIRTEDATVSGTVTASEMTACADAEADLCGGGDLDLESGNGTPDWTEAAIFGDTIIRDGNQLTGVTRTTASTGVFGILAGSSLTVGGCLRSVSPFIHGAGC